MTITKNMYAQAGLSPEDAAAQMLADSGGQQAQWDKFNVYNPVRAENKLSPSAASYLFNQNQNAANPTSADAFATGLTSQGLNPTTGNIQATDPNSPWKQFTNLFSGTGDQGVSNFWGTGGIAGGISSGLGAIGSIWSAVNAGKANKLAEESFDFNKRAYDQNNMFQAQGLNEQLTDRYKGRQAAMGKNYSESLYGSLDSYMDKHGYNPKSLA